MAATLHEAWNPILALGRLYALAGSVFRDDFDPGESREWAEAWRASAAAWGRGSAIAEATDALVAAVDESSRRPEDILAERSRLLLLGGCPAYETTYVDAFSRPRELADVAGFYRAFGVRSTGEREDHLSVECEFVGFLCLKEAIARASGLEEEAGRCREARAAFLRDHLGTWLRAYEADLAERARMPLLPAAAAAVRTIVHRDAEELGVTVVERSRPRPETPDGVPPCGPIPQSP